MSTPKTPIQNYTRGPRQLNEARKRKQSAKTEKEEIKLPLFANHITAYVENPKESTKRLPRTKSEFSKVVGYKVSIQYSIVILYTSNELEIEILKVSFTIAPKGMKYI